jgi:hypothetical protein
LCKRISRIPVHVKRSEQQGADLAEGGDADADEFAPASNTSLRCRRTRMDLFIRTIGIARATVKIGMANLVYNMRRLVFLNRLVAA